MLARLMEYAHNHDLIAEPGFTAKTVVWVVDCSTASGSLDILRLGDPDDKRNRGRSFPCCPELTQPELIGGKEPRSHFLVETAEVMLLHSKGTVTEKKRERNLAKNAFFLRTLRHADAACSGLARAAELLADEKRSDELRSSLARKKAKPTDKVTLRVDGHFPLESDSWHEWWRGYRRSLSPEKGGAVRPMVCLLTGELAEPLRVQPKIVGLADVGGLPTGETLSAFDKDSFGSYGLEQGANAAVSETAFTACRSALNHLLAHSSHRIPGARIVYWFKNAVSAEKSPVDDLFDPEDPEEERSALRAARELLHAIARGERPDLDDNRYYILTLSGQAGRVMVRDWEEGPFEELLHNTCAWFEDLAIVHREGGRLAPLPKFLAVAGALVRELKDVPTPMLAQLWRSALRRGPLPASVLPHALRRVRVDATRDNPFNHARMGILKAFLLRNSQKGVSMDPYLDSEHSDAAYHCGRLMAVLAQLQYRALGNVGAGVVQRYYVAASQAPALTFGRLMGNSKNHLHKLKGGLPMFFERKMADIMGKIQGGFPRTLDLERQSLFALGYYQQIAFDRARVQKPDADVAQTNGQEEEIND